MNTKFTLWGAAIALIFVTSFGLKASSFPALGIIPSGTGYELPPCNEPAPNNYHISELGTNFIKVDWDAPAHPPFEYNIKVWETATGNLVYEQTAPGNYLSWRVPGQPATEYKIRNTPVCSSGVLSTNFVESTGTTLITDLVVSGFTNDNNAPLCSLLVGGAVCSINPSSNYVVNFRIRLKDNENDGRLFGVYRFGANCNYLKTKKKAEDESPSGYNFYCSNGGSNYCLTDVITIKKGDPQEEIAQIFYSFLPNGGGFNVYCSSINHLYQIDRLGSGVGVWDEFSGSCGLSRSPGQNDDYERLAAIPNPFSDQLEIQIPFAKSDKDTEISLYDLQGRSVTALRYPGDQQSITLSTVSLAPGMYFLRAQSGENSETVKVVKTQ